jgi:electron transfer flavoprotein alpha subunit
MKPMLLVVAEQNEGVLNRASWEVVAAAQALDHQVAVAVLGAETAAPAAELAAADVAEVIRVDHPALETYTADAVVQALAQVVAARAPTVVLLPHTYQTRDFAPALATRLDRSLITDCVGIKTAAAEPVFVRPMFQGKLYADVRPLGEAPHLATMQIGAYRADAVRRGDAPAPIVMAAVEIDAASIRQRPEPRFQEARQAVDLSQAERIVAVGRGIKDEKHLELVTRLATAIGAEIGASRPICDNGWLPMDRQIGSSGQTVAPKLYIALGISGAIQHLVGMKGARTIVAINKDADAPICEVADYGIVADLFDIVPALTESIGS